MRRIFLTFYLFVMLVLVAITFLVDPIGQWYFDTFLEEELEIHLTDLSRGTFYLVAEDLRDYPEAQWQERVRLLQREFGYTIAIQPIEKAAMSSAETALLSAGNYVFRDDGEYILHRVRRSGQVLTMGPFPNFDESRQMKRLEAVAIISVLLFVGILSLLWAMPFWRNLKAVMTAAGRLGRGDFDARAEVMRFSALKALAEAFNAMADRIQRLLRSHKMLLNAVSHELRTPIARVRFGIEMASSPDPMDRKRYLSGIVKDLDDLDALVSELLLYARFDRERPELLIEALPAMEWLSALVARAGETSSGILFRVCEEGVPENVPGDARYLTRAVENLLSNAGRHAASRVTVGLTVEGGHLRLRVDDDGPGIPEVERGRIFDPFVRLDQSRSRDSGGYGLGLAIVRQILEWHGGTAKASESPSGGGRFTLDWPR